MTGPLPGSILRELRIMDSKGCEIWDSVRSCSLRDSIDLFASGLLDPLLLLPEGAQPPEPSPLSGELCSQTHLGHNALGNR